MNDDAVLRQRSSGESAPTVETLDLIGCRAHRLEQIVASQVESAVLQEGNTWN